MSKDDTYLWSISLILHVSLGLDIPQKSIDRINKFYLNIPLTAIKRWLINYWFWWLICLVFFFRLLDQISIWNFVFTFMIFSRCSKFNFFLKHSISKLKNQSRFSEINNQIVKFASLSNVIFNRCQHYEVKPDLYTLE